MKENIRVSIVQYGARHRYLIPQILEQAGLLEKLYTDSCNHSILGKILKLASLLGIKAKSVIRLLNREPKIPPEKIISNDLWQIKILLSDCFSSRYNQLKAVYQGGSKLFCRTNIAESDWLYAMFIENIAFTEYAKSRGVKIITDIYENPYIFKELADEVQINEELACIRHLSEEYLIQYNFRLEYVDKLLEISDKYLVPSDYVATCLKNNSKYYDEQKTNIIPYVSSITNSTHNNQPQRGRIIWVGNEPVRKGLVYALRAVNQLKNKYPELDFRVIGSLPREIVESPYFKSINFIGHCTKEQLMEEFRQADMYVFPTLGEGFAGTLLEAASFGVPIITTRASGFADDFPGIFVSLRDVDGIIDSITYLLENRLERDRISHEIFKYSQRFNKENFEKQLIELFQKNENRTSLKYKFTSGRRTV